ncbi:unnamed protein product, partial [marine sediment metagenome]
MSETSRRYRSRDSYISKDPVKRQHSLDNLSKWRNGRFDREKILREIGYYLICPYCKKSVVDKDLLKVIGSLLHFSRCKDCQHLERLPEPESLIWDDRVMEIVALCNKGWIDECGRFFTERQLARDNE